MRIPVKGKKKGTRHVSSIGPTIIKGVATMLNFWQNKIDGQACHILLRTGQVCLSTVYVYTRMYII